MVVVLLQVDDADDQGYQLQKGKEDNETSLSSFKIFETYDRLSHVDLNDHWLFDDGAEGAGENGGKLLEPIGSKIHE